MRKVLITILFVAVTTIANAQINKGQFMVGGNAGFTSSKYEGSEGSLTQISFNPNFGYFFANKFAGGLRLNLSHFSSGGESSTAVVAAPFLRYYFLPSAQKTNVFADVSYGFGTTGDGVVFPFVEGSINQFSIEAGPAIFLSPNVALEFALNYTSQGGEAFNDNSSGEDKRYNTFGLRVGFQIHLGHAK